MGSRLNTYLSSPTHNCWSSHVMLWRDLELTILHHVEYSKGGWKSCQNLSVRLVLKATKRDDSSSRSVLTMKNWGMVHLSNTSMSWHKFCLLRPTEVAQLKPHSFGR